MSRYEPDAVLKQHGIPEDLVSAKELDEQLDEQGAGFRNLLGA